MRAIIAWFCDTLLTISVHAYTCTHTPVGGEDKEKDRYTFLINKNLMDLSLTV